MELYNLSSSSADDGGGGGESDTELMVDADTSISSIIGNNGGDGQMMGETSFGMAGTADDVRSLAELGYKQELYRGFNGFMSFAFCFTAVSVIPSISVGFNTSIMLGGSAEIVWAWVVGSLFCIIAGCAMAEITSVYPSAGSVYHWAGQLAPVKYAPIASFVCGWFNFLGNVAGDAAFASGFASCVNYVVNIRNPGVDLSVGAQVGISILVLAVWSLLNVARTDQQGWFNNVAVLYQLSASLIIVIVLLSMAPEYASASDVFVSVYDNTGLSSDTARISPFTVVVGLVGCLFAFTGYEAGAHMAEETRDARTSAPWGIVATVLMCAVFGLVYILGLLFATPDITNLDVPVRDIYTSAAGTSGGLALMVLLIICFFFAGMSSTTVTSRIVFAMVRDGAMPFSKVFYSVNQYTKSPVRSVFLVFVFDAFLLLLPFINTAALAAITGTATVGYQISYAIPILLRVTVGASDWRPGKWNLGRWSLPVAWIATVWQIASSVIFFLPLNYPVTSKNMNYTVVVVVGTLLIASLYWFVSARKFFVGPKRVKGTGGGVCEGGVCVCGMCASG